MSIPLVINEEVREQIKALCELAHANPINMVGLLERMRLPENKKRHMAQMSRQTITIPLAYTVTFSIEHGHPIGSCRHMSMSVERQGRAPSPEALWMVAKEFGFWGTLENCVAIWHEKLRGHGWMAINVVQLLAKPVV